MKPVVVLGGGLTGLTLAFRLRQAGRDVLVLESESRAGGCIQTEVSGGYVAERGPTSILTRPSTDALCADIGLQDDAVTAGPKAPRFIVRYGRPIALSPGPLAMLAPILSWPAKVRVLADLVKPAPGDLHDESIEAFFTRRFGAEVARYLAGPFVSGVYAGDPARISVRSAFPKLWEAERTYRVGVVRGFTRMRKAQKASGIARYERKTLSFRGGLAQLTSTLRRRLGDCVIEGAPALGIRPTAGIDGARFHVDAAGGRTFEASTVVSTLPSGSLAELLQPLVPSASEPLRAIPTVSVVVLSLAYPEAAFERVPRGFGALIPRGEGFRMLGCLYPSSLFPGRAPGGESLLTAFVGGAFDPAAVDLPDGELVEIARSEIARLLPNRAEPRVVAVARHRAAIPQYELGHHERIASIDAALDPLAGFHALGNWRDGVALADRIESAEAKARELAAAVGE